MRIFVTHICPKDKIIEYGLSISASNFNYNLIEGGGFDKVFSIYPGFSRGKLDKVDNEQFEAVYSSWRSKGGLRQRLARFREQISLFKKIKSGSDVWFYNMTTINALLIGLLKVFKPSCGLNIIMLDYDPDQWFPRMMLPLINSLNGRICLSTYKGFNRDNYVCLPGVVPKHQKQYSKIIKEVKKEFLLSGALKENITMHSMVLDAFAEMPDLTLHISGSLIDHKEKVMEYSKKYPNIIFHGKMPFDEFERLLEEVPFSLNTRKPTAIENKCNFPSKVIEALCNNRIVISTIEYPQIESFNYLHVGSDLESFIKDIRRIADMPQSDLLNYANQGEKAIELYSPLRWFEEMSRLENHKKRNN
ncbi:MAG: glycosyltransferase family 4 protein [Bacteroides sp.]|nr:glycosyltransferase family 4 protein [Bacteroides sp.]